MAITVLLLALASVLYVSAQNNSSTVPATTVDSSPASQLPISSAGAPLPVVGAPVLMAVKVESPILGYTEDGTVRVQIGKSAKLGFVGRGLQHIALVRFITGTDCSDTTDVIHWTKVRSEGEYEVFVEDVQFEEKEYGVCIQSANTTHYHNYCDEKKMRIKGEIIDKKYVMGSMGAQLIVCVVLGALSGLFSGLNLGLMSLSPEDLELVMRRADDPKHRQYATTILPIRKQGNFLLCSLLFGNVIVNTLMTVLFDEIVAGLMAVVIATFVIVIFGEIIPQSACQKYSLQVGAKTIYITIFFMILTGPLSFPIGKLLDCILNHEFKSGYNRERLFDVIRMQIKEDIGEAQGTEIQEMQIFQGCLQYSKKTVRDIMTPVEDMFMLQENELLDRDKLAALSVEGYTRIPLYGKTKDDVKTLLNMKDLALLDPDDKLPAAKVAATWNRKPKFVDADIRLPEVLQCLKEGDTHMAIVKDKDNKNVGLVTLEDVLEEILGMELKDETDATRGASGSTKARKDKKAAIIKKKRDARKLLGKQKKT